MSVSERMSRIRSVSQMERDAKKLCEAKTGVRLRHQPSGLPGRPDYANKAKKVAVFVDGCLWHGCPKHFRLPKTNSGFWALKVSNNVLRRRKVARELRRLGWTVTEVWEHEVRRWLKANSSARH